MEFGSGFGKRSDNHSDSVKSINGRQIGDGDIPGKITKRLQEAFIDSIGFDYVSQYLSHLSG